MVIKKDVLLDEVNIDGRGRFQNNSVRLILTKDAIKTYEYIMKDHVMFYIMLDLRYMNQGATLHYGVTNKNIQFNPGESRLLMAQQFGNVDALRIKDKVDIWFSNQRKNFPELKYELYFYYKKNDFWNKAIYIKKRYVFPDPVVWDTPVIGNKVKKIIKDITKKVENNNPIFKAPISFEEIKKNPKLIDKLPSSSRPSSERYGGVFRYIYSGSWLRYMCDKYWDTKNGCYVNTFISRSNYLRETNIKERDRIIRNQIENEIMVKYPQYYKDDLLSNEELNKLQQMEIQNFKNKFNYKQNLNNKSKNNKFNISKNSNINISKKGKRRIEEIDDDFELSIEEVNRRRRTLGMPPVKPSKASTSGSKGYTRKSMASTSGNTDYQLNKRRKSDDVNSRMVGKVIYSNKDKSKTNNANSNKSNNHIYLNQNDVNNNQLDSDTVLQSLLTLLNEEKAPSKEKPKYKGIWYDKMQEKGYTGFDPSFIKMIKINSSKKMFNLRWPLSQPFGKTMLCYDPTVGQEHFFFKKFLSVKELAQLLGKTEQEVLDDMNEQGGRYPPLWFLKKDFYLFEAPIVEGSENYIEFYDENDRLFYGKGFSGSNDVFYTKDIYDKF